jgi:hypothetical protein
MSPERFEFLLEQFRKRCRKQSKSVHHAAVAEFLGVDIRTLRRWRKVSGTCLARSL